MTTRQQILRMEGTITSHRVAAMCSVGLRTAQKYLAALVCENKLICVKVATETNPAEYQLISPPEEAPPAVERVLKKQQEKSWRNDVKRLEEELVVAKKQQDILAGLRDQPTAPPITPRSPKKDESAIVALLSDVHFEERVLPGQVSGLNEYNPDIAARRMRSFFRNMLLLVNKERALARIEQLVFWLGGDFFSGRIHDDLAEANYMGVMPATRAVKAELQAGIDFLMEQGDFKRIHVECSVGNHGRITKDRRMATLTETSLEWLLYADLAGNNADRKGLTFSLPEGAVSYFQVLDTLIRFNHGDSVRYYGGVGGPTIPFNKKVNAWDKGRRADCTVIGHLHQLHFLPGGVINGSVIGYGPFAQGIAAEMEPPQQGMFSVVTGRRRPCCYNIVFLEGEGSGR